MKKLLFIVLLFFTSFSFAQLENANWCFGFNAGVNFNTNPPTAISSQITLTNPGSCEVSASVSDDNGQLLFYTDGINVWDKNNVAMPNGNGLYGYSDLENSQQTVVIVPKPGNPNIYYIFTLGAIGYVSSGTSPVGRGGMHYSVVDMSLNGGNGDVVPNLKNVILKDQAGNPIDYPFDYNATNTNPFFISEKSRITTSLHASGQQIWVSIIADFYYNFQHTRWFYNYLVSQNGIGMVADGISPEPTASSQLAASNYTENNPFHAVMKVSPNGQFLCDAEDIVNLYNYNNQNGTISFNNTIYDSNLGGNGGHSLGYGLEFSPNSQLIYFTDNPDGIQQSGRGTNKISSKNYVTLFQYHIQRQYLEAIYNYPAVSPGDAITPIPSEAPYGIQLSMDNKIYVCALGYMHQYMNYLGVINSPNTQGIGCNFVPTGLQLLPNTANDCTLPQWVHKATTVIWPKVYAFGSDPSPVVGYSSLAIGNGSSLFYGFTTHDMTINTNHNGGTVPTAPGTYTVQYDKNSGITTWIQPNMLPKFVLSTGQVQMLTSLMSPLNTLITTVFLDPVSGNLTTGPSVVPTNEIILAEDNGTYITRSTDSLHVHSQLGDTSIPFINGAANIVKTVYNTATKHLFIQYSSDIILPLAVYSLNNNMLTVINTPSQNTLGFLQQVNSLDEAFLFYNVPSIGTSRIEKYDFINDLRVPVSIPGFNNINLDFTRSYNPYADDKLMETQMTEGNIYALNTVILQEKKIPYTCQFNSVCNLGFGYWFEGDDLYMEVAADNQMVTVGNQTISPLGGASIGVTKFNIQTDFSLRPQAEEISVQQNIRSLPVEKNKTIDLEPVSFIKATLSPNPTKNSLTVNLKQDNDEAAASSFLVSITNSLGVVMFTQTTQQNRFTIDVAAFKTGTYYVTISTNKGDKITRVFMKE
jgi:hypothetical protein